MPVGACAADREASFFRGIGVVVSPRLAIVTTRHSDRLYTVQLGDEKQEAKEFRNLLGLLMPFESDAACSSRPQQQQKLLMRRQEVLAERRCRE